MKFEKFRFDIHFRFRLFPYLFETVGLGIDINTFYNYKQAVRI